MLRIAIIDDLSADRAVLREALERELAPRGAAFTIEEFASGEEFTAAFVPRRYDAAFIDIYMGEVSGMEVARLLYHRDPACRIIFLTTSQEFMLESYAVRATYYLVKPFAEERLRQALDFCFPAPDPSDLLTVPTKSGVQMLSRREIVCIVFCIRSAFGIRLCVCRCQRRIRHLQRCRTDRAAGDGQPFSRHRARYFNPTRAYSRAGGQ